MGFEEEDDTLTATDEQQAHPLLSTPDGYSVPDEYASGISKGKDNAAGYYSAAFYIDALQEALATGMSSSAIPMSSIAAGGTYRFGDGTLTSPAISWSNEIDSGRYRVGSQHFAEVVNATTIWEWTKTSVTFAVGTNVTLTGMTPGSILFAGTSGLVSQDNANLFWDDAGNRLGVGCNDPFYSLEVRHSSLPQLLLSTDDNNAVYFTGNLTGMVVAQYNNSGFSPEYDFTGDNLNGNPSLRIRNLHSTGATSHAWLVAEVGGASAGDPVVLWDVDFAQVWAAGIDNSDSDTWKVSKGATLGTNDYFKLDTSGNAYFSTGYTAGSVLFMGATGLISQNNASFFWDNANTRLGIGTTAPAAGGRLTVFGGAGVDEGIRVSMGSNANLRLVTTDGTAQSWIVRADTTAGAFRIIDETGGPIEALSIAKGTVLCDYNGMFRLGSSGSFSSTTRGLLLFSSSVDYKIGFDSVGGTKGYIRYNVDTNSAGSATWGHVFSGGVAGSQTDWAFLGGGQFGINTLTPRRRFDSLDAGSPQARLTYTDNSVYTDLQTDSSGNTTIIPTGTKVGIQAGANGQRIDIEELTELTTIAAAATTDTAIQIPLDAVVFAVSVRVTVVIPTAATFTVTGTTSGTQFDVAGGVSTAATTTDVGTRNCPYKNGAAQTIRITPNINPAANSGRVRVTIHFYRITPATS